MDCFCLEAVGMYGVCMLKSEYGWKDASLVNNGFKLVLCKCCVSKGFASFASLVYYISQFSHRYGVGKCVCWMICCWMVWGCFWIGSILQCFVCDPILCSDDSSRCFFVLYEGSYFRVQFWMFEIMVVFSVRSVS